MLKDITIGQYYPVDSPLHKLDPRVKILGTFLFMISLFIVDSFLPYILVLLFLGTVIKISKVPVQFILKGLKPIFMILGLTFMINALLTPGEEIFAIWKLTVTREGLTQGTFMAIRLVLLIMGTSLLTLATSPIQLTDGIESLLKPYKKIGVPAHELAMMMTIALRFIPTLLDETDKIMKAQMARGADFESANMVERAKSLVPLLVPLFISAFRRADDLAMAMEARCYRGGDNRTRMNEMKSTGKDKAAFCIVLAYLAVIIGLRILM